MHEESLITESIPEGITTFLKALSDPNRLRIFATLRHGASCNGWLMAELGLPANLLSHHLKVLREAGLVQDRRDEVDGRWIYYQVDESTLTVLHQWMGEFFDPARAAQQTLLCHPEIIAPNTEDHMAQSDLEAATV